MKKYNSAIVGIRGAVGQEMLKILEERNFPVNELHPMSMNPQDCPAYTFNGQDFKAVKLAHDAFKGIEAIIQSMSPKERSNPEILNGSRKNRIASGSGTNIQEVNKLIKQFKETKKIMHMMSNKKNMANMMRQMKGKGLPGM